MKKILKALSLALLLVPWAARAQAPWSVTLDEYGNGIAINATGQQISFNGQMMADPSGGLAANVLVYNLPFNFPAASAGDYLLLEPPNYATVSDVVRFWAPAGQGGNQVIFYSDLPDVDELPPIPLADTGLPGSYLQIAVPLQESGFEGGYQAASHNALSGDPGYIGANLANYTFISDVPEPALLAVMALGGLVGVACLSRRNVH